MLNQGDKRNMTALVYEILIVFESNIRFDSVAECVNDQSMIRSMEWLRSRNCMPSGSDY